MNFTYKSRFGVNIGLNITSSLLGDLVVIVTGLSQLKKYQDNWILYRTTAELLKKEKFLCMNSGGEFSDLVEDTKNKLFVERIKSVIFSETIRYFTIHKTEKESKVGQPPDPNLLRPEIERTNY